MVNENKSNPLNIANIPKGIGISNKVFMVVGLIALVIIFTVICLLVYYRSHKGYELPKPQNTLVQQQNSITPEDAINRLNQNAKTGSLVKGSSKQSVPVNEQTSAPASSLNDQQKLQAAQAPIAVVNNYQGPTQQPQVNPSASDKNSQNGIIPSASNDNPDNYQQQNMQGEKTAFLQTNNKQAGNFYLDSKLTNPVSPYEVKAGTIIPATLVTGINSDLPGEIIAQVSQNVYDTVTGNYLLIPQGTRVIGVYDNQVAYGQSRVLIAWSRLLYPNGQSFDLEGQPGVDLAGMAGLHDLVDNHYMRIFGSALMFSMFGALGQMSQPQQSNNNGALSNQQIIYGAVGTQLTQTGAQMVQKNMNIQPTLEIRQGAEFRILLTRDMVLPGPYRN
jgi:type IV secretory pathway VirB10-like protein